MHIKRKERFIRLLSLPSRQRESAIKSLHSFEVNHHIVLVLPLHSTFNERKSYSMKESKSTFCPMPSLPSVNSPFATVSLLLIPCFPATPSIIVVCLIVSYQASEREVDVLILIIVSYSSAIVSFHTTQSMLVSLVAVCYSSSLL